MTEAKTFDLAAVFSGRAFPKETVNVYLDEASAYAISRANKAITEAVGKNDEEKILSLQNEVTELAKKAEASKFEFHLTGVSRQARKTALDETLEKFPVETDAFGRMKQSDKANDYLANLSWKLHVEKIIDPSGAELDPSIEDIIIFRDNAPDPVIEAIEAGINELSEGVKSGFETIVQEHDFLSKASQGA